MFRTRLPLPLLSFLVPLLATGGCTSSGEESAAQAEEREVAVADRPQDSEWWRVHPRPNYASLEKTGTCQD